MNTAGKRRTSHIKGGNEKMSFWLDWWMLIGFGFGMALLSKTKLLYKEDSFFLYYACAFILVMFYVVSIGLLLNLKPEDNIILGTMNQAFFDILKQMNPGYYAAHPIAAESSTEFMYSSANMFWDWGTINIKDAGGILNGFFGQGVPFNSLEELVADHPMYLYGGILIFCLYPAFIYLGTQLGYLLFGRKPGDKGVIGLL